MKTRNGFVSNSSSSSFVIVGYKLEMPKNNSEKLEMLKKLYPERNLTEDNIIDDIFHESMEQYSNFDILYDGEGGYLYVGNLVEYTDQADNLENKSVNISECLVKCEKSKNVLNVKDQEIMIHVGSIYN